MDPKLLKSIVIFSRIYYTNGLPANRLVTKNMFEMPVSLPHPNTDPPPNPGGGGGRTTVTQ